MQAASVHLINVCMRVLSAVGDHDAMNGKLSGASQGGPPYRSLSKYEPADGGVNVTVNGPLLDGVQLPPGDVDIPVPLQVVPPSFDQDR